MRLSVMSYTLARQLQGDKQFDIPAMCRLARELGIDGVDMVTLYGYDPKEVRRIVDDHGIKVICHTFMADLNHPDGKGRQAGIDAIKRAVEVAKILGTDKLMFPAPGKEGLERRKSRDNITKGLAEAAHFAADAGVYLSVENFSGETSPFVTADDFLEAAHAVPTLKLTYDNGNAFTGEDPAESFARCAEYVIHAHFKDWVETHESEGRRMLNGKRYKGALIGEGEVDHKSCIAAMKAAGYDGYINIEYEGSEYAAADATRKAAAYLKNLLAELSG